MSEQRQKIGWRMARVGMSILACSVLSACASGVDTAWKLIQQQQEQQALVRQHESRERDRRAPAEPQWLLAMMREAGEEGRYFAALAYGDDYRQRFGRQPEVELMRAEALRLIGQAEESEAIYRALLSTPQAAQAWHGLGLLAGAGGNYAGAVEALSQAARLLPTQADVLNDLGYARLRAGQWPQARVPLGQAAELDPANPRVLANLALLLSVQGDGEAAVQVMERAGMDEAAQGQVREMAQELRLAAATPAVRPDRALAAAPPAAAPPAAVPPRYQPAGQSPVLDAFGPAVSASSGGPAAVPAGVLGG